jgi:hypothetical protein
MYVPGADWSVVENAICVCSGINRKDTFVFISDQSQRSNWLDPVRGSPKVGVNEVMWLEAFGYAIDKESSKGLMRAGARGALVLRCNPRAKVAFTRVKQGGRNDDGLYCFHDLIEAVPPQYMGGFKDLISVCAQQARGQELFMLVRSLQRGVDLDRRLMAGGVRLTSR